MSVYVIVSVHVNEILILFACEHTERLFCWKTDVPFRDLNCTIPTVNAFDRNYPFFIWIFVCMK
jgi:hypothetical protein